MQTGLLFLEHAAKMDAPFIAFFLVANAWAIAIAVLSRNESLRNGAILCGSVLIGLAVVETCLYYATKSQVIITQTVPREWRRNAVGLDSVASAKYGD